MPQQKDLGRDVEKMRGVIPGYMGAHLGIMPEQAGSTEGRRRMKATAKQRTRYTQTEMFTRFDYKPRRSLLAALRVLGDCCIRRESGEDCGCRPGAGEGGRSQSLGL